MHYKNNKLYTIADFRDADKMERLKMALLEESLRPMLTDRDERYLQAIESAFALTFKVEDDDSILVSEREAVKMIQKMVGGCESWQKASNAYHDMMALFTPFFSKKKGMRKVLYAQKLLELARRAESVATTAKDWGDVSRIYERAYEAEGLDRDDSDRITHAMPKVIIIGSDAATLKAEQERLDANDDDGDDY